MRICLASDFFYPGKGGVQVHIFKLAQYLSKKHHVIVITHQYQQFKGVHYFKYGFKVYYCPFFYFSNGITAPTFLIQFPLIRQILIRQNIQLIHTHQSSSPLSAVVSLTGLYLNRKLVHTQHSLFSTDDLAGININKLFKMFFRNYDKFIAVSQVTRQNIYVRGMIPSNKINIIPNAIQTDIFYPRPQLRDQQLTIIFLCRLVYRKGVDLLVDLLPIIIQENPFIKIIIAGAGPKQAIIKSVVAQKKLQKSIQFIPMVQHSQVPILLNRAHIFLNTSLTESFCMAVLQACSCGLISISTNVGGIPQILPQNCLILADPNVSSLIKAIRIGVELAKDKKVSNEAIDIIKKSYNWRSVSQQIERVYKVIKKQQISNKQKIKRFNESGRISGLLMIFLMGWMMVLDYLFSWWPIEIIMNNQQNLQQQ